MKRSLSTLVWILVLALIGWFAWGYFFPSETKRICKRLNSFSKNISFAKGSSVFVRMAGADSTRDYFATNVVVDLDGVHNQAEYLSGRAEVMNIITLARTHLHELNLRFKDPVVTLDPDKIHASMDVVAQVVIDEQRYNRVHQLMRLGWVKNNDKWRIERVETLQMLGRETGEEYFPTREE